MKSFIREVELASSDAVPDSGLIPELVPRHLTFSSQRMMATSLGTGEPLAPRLRTAAQPSGEGTREGAV